MSAHSDEARASTVASLRTAPSGGHGCAVPEHIPTRTLAERVNLPELERYTAGVLAARAAYMADWRRR